MRSHLYKTPNLLHDKTARSQITLNALLGYTHPQEIYNYVLCSLPYASCDSWRNGMRVSYYVDGGIETRNTCMSVIMGYCLFSYSTAGYMYAPSDPFPLS